MKFIEHEIEAAFIDQLYQLKVFNPKDFGIEILNGQYILLKAVEDNQKTAVLYRSGNDCKVLNLPKKFNINGMYPKDTNQALYMSFLKDDNIQVLCAIGPAGTGKTTLAIANAIEDMRSKKRKLLLCKSTAMVKTENSNAFGPVPGDVAEKYSPYISSFEIALQKVMGGEDSKDYIKTMIEKQQIQFLPLEFTRGCTFDNCTLILDEAQNLNWHELKTLMSRLGENSKLILCGDPDQIDVNLKWKDTGFYLLINSQPFKESDIVSLIKLEKCYRGPIPELIYNIDKQMNEKEET